MPPIVTEIWNAFLVYPLVNLLVLADYFIHDFGLAVVIVTVAIRLAVTAPRTLGRSVARNRARRRLREAFRVEIVPLDIAGHDLLIVARSPASTAGHAALRAAAREALLRLDARQ